jgi:hypothetical protein
MKLPLAAASVIMAIAVSYCGFVRLCPRTSHSLGFDVWNYFKEKNDLDESVRRGSKFERDNQLIRQITSRRDVIVRDLIHGRITLSDASERSLALNREYPELTTMSRFNYPSDSDEESSAMQLLRHVRVCANSDSSLADVVAHLEMELKNMRESRSKSSNNKGSSASP